MAQVTLISIFGLDAQRFRAAVWLACAVAPLLCGARAKASQTVRPQPVSLEQRIAQEKELVRAGEKEGIDSLHMGRLWATLASDYEEAGGYVESEDAYNHALKLLRGSVAARPYYALALDGLGALYLLTGQMAESENCRRKALAIFNEEGDRKNVNMLHGNLAVILLKENKYKDAEREASKAIEGMLGQAKPPTGLISALIARGYASCFQRRCKEGLSDAQQAVDITRSIVQPNSLAAASSWSALGYMEWKTGDVEGADEKMQRALQILSEKSDLPSQVLVGARMGTLRQYQQFLNETHRKAEARQVGDEMARLTKAQMPVCRNCTVNVEGLSNPLH